ncbi:MAG: hypothetical protein R2713_18940 [Ilumatobacteraceae bacterium]|nr:hypothetical protein [Acidimicrobiales bacterium]MCB9393772.1 hypothetical protein [Acidimicrobiaceae bacterium]
MSVQPTRERLDVIAGTLVHDRAKLSIADARTLYLFAPGYVREMINGRVFVRHVRSSLDAALGDVRGVSGRDGRGNVVDLDQTRCWLGASGYLMLLDQICTVFDYGGFEGLLTSDMAGLSADEAGAIYGLRNAFVHSYGLVNDAKGLKDATRRRRRHTFNLTVGQSTLVTLGDRTNVLTAKLPDLPPTTIDLGRLGDHVEMIVEQIRASHLTGVSLPWAVTDIDEFVGLSFFSHYDTI